jgi:MFS family permease
VTPRSEPQASSTEPDASSPEPDASSPEPDASSPEPRRALTAGLVLGVTVMAFGSLAVVTIAPRIPAELGGLAHYGWIFSANLLASLVGTVWGGAQADRRGPGRAFVLGLAAFLLGSALAALAPSMLALILARGLQGLGGGAVITCIYVAVTLAYPDGERARVIVLLSAAWVLPALIGPAAAGMVAELTSWRWVFAALVPLTGLVGLLALPSFLALSHRSAAQPGRGPGRLWSALLLAASVGVGLWSLTAPAPVYVRLLAVAAALAVAPGALARLTPERTLRLAPGLASVVAARGLFFAGFVAVEVYLALMLTDLLGLSSAVTGAVIASGALVWTLGSWVQARLDGARARVAPAQGADATPWGAHGPVHPFARALALALALARRRELRVLLGTVVLCCGLGAQLAALAVAGPGGERAAAALTVALLGWLVAGLGIGFAHAGSTVLAFERAELEHAEAGTVSAALQLADGVGAATATGVAGALLALLAPVSGLAAGVAAAYGVGLGAAGLSLLAAWRIGALPLRSRAAVP